MRHDFWGPLLRRRTRRLLGLATVGCVTASSLALSGCAKDRKPVSYLGDHHGTYTKSVSTEIDHPALISESPPNVAETLPPHTIDREVTDTYDIPLAEAIQTSLANNELLRTNGTFLAGGGVLGDLNGVQSVYDPAAQETSIALGQGGVESALAAFDASFATSMFWSRDESINNFAGQIINQTTEGANFNATLAKVFGTGASVALGHNVNYTGVGGGGFGGGMDAGEGLASTYSGNTAVQFRQPLLAGAGTEYTRIAGPRLSPTGNLSSVTGGLFGGQAGGFGTGVTSQLTGVSNGVVIARINNDITLTQFEATVRDMIRDVEEVYWDLYLAYRNFDTAVTQRNSALATWRVAKTQRNLGTINRPAEEAQARDQYFEAEAQVETARSSIFETETRLRRLMNLPVSDGRVLRPADEPMTAELVPEWYACLSDALVNRVELRRRKWEVKSLQLQRKAARNLLKPEMDFIAGYQVNGFGDQLLGYNDPGLGEEGSNFYESQTNGDLTGWQMGVVLSTPIGRRRANSQLRNIEFRLAKAQKALAVAEHEVSQELAAAFQELSRTRNNVKTLYSRRAAAIENVALLEPLLTEGAITLDEVLRAQARRATAEDSFFTALVNYNQAILNLQYRKGTLLEYDNVTLLEGPWCPEAYRDANRRADGRAHAQPARWKHVDPAPFASDLNPDPVGFTSPAAADASGLSVEDGFLTSPQDDPIPPMPESGDDGALTPKPMELPDEPVDGGLPGGDLPDSGLRDSDTLRPEDRPNHRDAGPIRLPELTDRRDELIGDGVRPAVLEADSASDPANGTIQPLGFESRQPRYTPNGAGSPLF